MLEQMSWLSKGDGVMNQCRKCLTSYKQTRKTQQNPHSLMHGLILMYNIHGYNILNQNKYVYQFHKSP